jgi:hypothetical protein
MSLDPSRESPRDGLPEPAAADQRPARGGEQVAAAIAHGVDEARAEVTRTDTKAGTLLTLATGALALMVALGTRDHRLSFGAAVAMWCTAALDGAAALALLSVVRPRLSRGGMLGDHAALLRLEVGAQIDGWQRDRLDLMSRLAHTKHRRVRLAVDLLVASLAALAIAAVLAF